MVGTEELLTSSQDGRHYPYVVVKSKPTKKFTLMMTGHILSKSKSKALSSPDIEPQDQFKTAVKSVWQYWQAFGQGANLKNSNQNHDISRLNGIMTWYFHNAMVHFTTPHGLEQYSGAAWGLRDVCQGPVELLLCTKNYRALKTVIKIIYAHQYETSGDWPMVDMMFDGLFSLIDQLIDIIIQPSNY